MAVAFGGVLGAFILLYEVRVTKRLAQAEFIRDLQTSFTSDDKIGIIWSKLLLRQQITEIERPLVSNYLTFFETVHLLIDQGSLELELADDLFRNRFFSAIGDDGILQTALLRDAGAFRNIHELIRVWHDYLLRHDRPIHLGYYSYVEALTNAKGYSVERLSTIDLVDLKKLQDSVLESLETDGWLRANTDVMLEQCLEEQLVIGARFNGQLVAASILYDGKLEEENIKRYFTDDPELLHEAINLKLVLTDPSHRRSGLARSLIELLEKEATGRGKTEILCTIHSDNVASKRLFSLLGYRRLGSVMTGYGKRDVFARHLHSVASQWVR